jgi:hypothetical protein
MVTSAMAAKAPNILVTPRNSSALPVLTEPRRSAALRLSDRTQSRNDDGNVDAATHTTPHRFIAPRMNSSICL